MATAILKVAVATALIIGATVPAQNPSEPEPGPDGRWVCELAKEWKAVMRRNHPTADRSAPVSERYCRLPRD